MRMEDLTPNERRIILCARNMKRGQISFAVSDFQAQLPEIKIPADEFLKAIQQELAPNA